MSRKMYNTEELASIFYKEGIGYALTKYFHAEDIEDPKLREICLEAKTLIKRISTITGGIIK